MLNHRIRCIYWLEGQKNCRSHCKLLSVITEESFARENSVKELCIVTDEANTSSIQSLSLQSRLQNNVILTVERANKTEIDISTAREQKGLGTIGARHVSGVPLSSSTRPFTNATRERYPAQAARNSERFVEWKADKIPVSAYRHSRKYPRSNAL